MFLEGEHYKNPGSPRSAPRSPARVLSVVGVTDKKAMTGVTGSLWAAESLFFELELGVMSAW